LRYAASEASNDYRRKTTPPDEWPLSAKSGRSSISSLAVSRFALSLHMWISAPGERATFPYKTIADPLAFWN
jgi:hypothetical protein